MRAGLVNNLSGPGLLPLVVNIGDPMGNELSGVGPLEFVHAVS